MTLSIQLIKIPEGETVTRREYHVTETPFVIGCEFDCDLVLPDGSAKLSGQHVELVQEENGQYYAIDRSADGTDLNGEAMRMGGKAPVYDGDQLMLGGYQLMLGIFQSVDDADPTERKEPKLSPPPFRDSPNITYQGLLYPGAQPEQPIEDREPGFTRGGAELEDNLLFDPFGDGPELNEMAARPPKRQTARSQEPEADRPMALYTENLDEQSRRPPPKTTGQSDWLLPEVREDNEVALEATVKRFLDLVDPEKLEAEYRDYLGPLSRGKRRFWTIHKRHFSRKRSNGEYVRLFKALLAEEIRKR